MTNRDRVTIDDIRRVGYCVSGVRGWFKVHRLDFRKFLREGMTVEEARAIGDGHMNAVVDRKLKLEGGES